jgi:hypothetical protein
MESLHCCMMQDNGWMMGGLSLENRLVFLQGESGFSVD